MPRVWSVVLALVFLTLPASGQDVADPPSPSAARAPAFLAADLQTFVPTQTFEGTSLDGWIGRSGAWRVENGEYVGVVAESGTGLLLLDAEHQDLALAARFRCEGCEPGILLRAEPHGEGMLGVLYVFREEGGGAFAVTFDAEGNEVARERLSPSPSPYPESMLEFREEFPGLGNLYAWDLGARRVVTPLDLDGGWNRMEIHLVGNSLRGLLNGAGTAEAGVAFVGDLQYGSVGLYVAGTPGTEIRFRDVGIKPMDVKDALPLEVTSPRFEKRVLDGMFRSEAVTAADVNQNGHMDVIAGPNVFFGPDFVTRQEIYVPRHHSPDEYPDPLLSSAGDVTGNGYPDVLNVGEPGRPGFLYVNPGPEQRRWDRHMVIPSVDNEVGFLADLTGDGQLEYVYGDGGFLGYARPGPDPTEMWTFHPITEKGPWGSMYAHGLGVGDINGNGRTDVVQAYGWWEHPEDPTDIPWTYHPVEFGRWGFQQGGPGGARTYVYDVNGDGLNDVVTSLEAHGFGLAWFEQQRDEEGNISFVQHAIMDDFAEPADGVTFAALHALTMADVDGDGLLDVITGKRWWAHFGENPNDPDAFGAPVLYWFRLVRDGHGGATFVPELINNHSGVGTDMTAADLTGNGLADILTSTRFGTIIFLNQGDPAVSE